VEYSRYGVKRMRGWRVGKVFGINLEINYTWLIIFGLIFVTVSGELSDAAREVPRHQLWLAALVTTVLFFVSLLLHELAHSVMAIRLGMKVSRITLFVFGGVAQVSHEPRSPGVEFKVAIVGPLMSLFLAAVFGLFYNTAKAHAYFLSARFTAFGVDDHGSIIGLVRMDDLQAVPRERWLTTTVREVARPVEPETMTIAADREAVEAMMQMAENNAGRLLVTDYAGSIIGIISQSDILRLVRVKGGLGI